MRYIEAVAVLQILKIKWIYVNLNKIVFPNGLHALRHYVANRWLSMGINLYEIKDFSQS